MVKEYIVPPAEGFPKENSLLRVFQHGEMPVEIGSIERGAFSYLGDWKLYMHEDGYGIAHRLGTKERVTDDQGDCATLVLHFVLPIANRGAQIEQETVKRMYDMHLPTLINQFTTLAHRMYGENIISVAQEPPEWMGKELEEMIK